MEWVGNIALEEKERDRLRLEKERVIEISELPTGFWREKDLFIYAMQ